MRRPARLALALPALTLLALGPLALAACRTEAPAPATDVAAQVGDAVLTEADVAQALAAVPAGLDSAEARRAVVDPWVRRALLVQDARAAGLPADPAVRERLAEAERAVLEAAALDRLYADSTVAPTDAAVRAFYARHRADFTLAEPAVRVRALRVSGPRREDRARGASDALRRVAASASPDSTFALAAREFSDDAAGVTALAATFVVQSRLAAADEALGRAVESLTPGPSVATIASGETLHVVQLIDRLPAGAVLPLAAVRGEIAERLAVRLRTDAGSRLVERLRAEAVARNTLRVR